MFNQKLLSILMEYLTTHDYNVFYYIHNYCVFANHFGGTRFLISELIIKQITWKYCGLYSYNTSITLWKRYRLRLWSISKNAKQLNWYFSRNSNGSSDEKTKTNFNSKPFVYVLQQSNDSFPSRPSPPSPKSIAAFAHDFDRTEFISTWYWRVLVTPSGQV